MILSFAFKPGIKIQHNDVRTQKIDSPIFEIFKIALASFRVEDKLSKALFFKNYFYWLKH